MPAAWSDEFQTAAWFENTIMIPNGIQLSIELTGCAWFQCQPHGASRPANSGDKLRQKNRLSMSPRRLPPVDRPDICFFFIHHFSLSILRVQIKLSALPRLGFCCLSFKPRLRNSLNIRQHPAARATVGHRLCCPLASVAYSLCFSLFVYSFGTWKDG